MIPDGWQIQDLTDVALIILGQSPPSSACNETVKGYPFYQGNADFGHLHPLPQRWIENPLKIAKKDDILISVRAPVGELNIANTDCCIGRGVGAIRPLSANRDFVYYTLLNARNSLASVSQGSTFDAINGKELRNLHILVPPLPEQIKIAAILSSVDDAIQATQVVIDQIRRIKQGLLPQLLTRGIGHTRFKQTEIGEIPETWESIPLGDFGNFTNGINKGKEDFGFGIPFVNLQDVFGVNRISSLPKGLVNATQQEIQRYSLKAGDVLFVRSSVKPSGVGLTAVITDNIDDVVFSGFLIRYRQSKSKLIAKYLEHCFYEPGFRRRLLTRSSVSANTNINQKALEQLLVAIPSEVEQKQISSVLDSVDCAINQEQQKVASLTKIKRGLMQDLLTGRMRVKLSEEATT